MHGKVRDKSNLADIDVSDDHTGASIAFGGLQNDHFNNNLLLQAIKGSFLGTDDSAGGEQTRQAVLAALKAIAPRDAFEGMLAVPIQCRRFDENAGSGFVMPHRLSCHPAACGG